MVLKEVPTPLTMEPNDIIFRSFKKNIGVDGIPFVFNTETHELRWNDEEVDPEHLVNIGRRLNGYLHPDAPMGNASYVGGSMGALELDAAARDLKFSGVDAWLVDHFSNAGNLEEARAILKDAKERIVGIKKETTS